MLQVLCALHPCICVFVYFASVYFDLYLYFASVYLCFCVLGRDDFNLTFMIFSGELPYDVGYPKKHIRPYGGGWGLLLYPAQQSPCWLNSKIGVFLFYFLFHVFRYVFNHRQLPKWASTEHNCVLLTFPTPRTSPTLMAENQPKMTQKT